VHHPHDGFAKNLLRDALSRACASETEVEVLAATQRIDVYTIPDPARAAERARMGLLGELADAPCLFEPFHDTPTLGQLRRCLNKQHTWHHELERRARAASAASASSAGSTPAEPRRDKPAAEEVQFPALVVIQALADLADLPGDAWEQSVATPLLVHFQLGSHGHPTNEEDDVSAEIQAWFEDYQRKVRNEGREEGERSMLLRLLRSRFGELPAATLARIEAADLADIERWAEHILGARTLADVLDGRA
jgi:hypothetical protein